MAKISLVIVDDFYDNPDEIRNNALNLSFRKKEGATYPGLEAIDLTRDWNTIKNKLRDYIPDKVDGSGDKNPPFPQGKFRIAMESDESIRIDKVHIDQQKWSGVIYLSKNEDCSSGLVFYKHKHTNSILWDNQWFYLNRNHLYHLNGLPLKEAMLELFRDPNEFEEIGTIPIRYNRAIVFMAHAFHGTGTSFGDKIENCRLTQHFEFYQDDL